MLRRLPWFCLLVLVACPTSLRAAPGPATPACTIPAEFTTPEEHLNGVATAIAAGGPVAVLAVGSATTVGDRPSGDRHSAFPYRMLDALQAALPKVSFDLTLRGGRGMTADDMLPLLLTALAAKHYSLVLWQTGTVEAVRGVPPDGMAAALQAGIEHAREAGADVVLIDPQFSRFLSTNVDLDPYETVLQQISALPGVELFHRFDVMQGWAEDGSIDLERAPRADRPRVMAQLNTCLGQALARFVLNGAGVPAP